MKNFRPFHIAAIAVIGVIYAAARLWNLTGTCLRFDEIFSISVAEHLWNSIFSFTAQDLIHPPLFYVLLKFWITAGGESIYWLRLLPVVFAIAAIASFLLLCKELKLDRWTKTVAFFLLAVNGSLIKYAQEVRMYSLLFCLSLISLWLFVRYFSRGKSLAALVIVNALLVYAHYFGWLVVASEILAIVLFQRIKIRAILAMFGTIVVAFLPWAAAVWRAMQSGSEFGQNLGWIERPGFERLIQMVFDLVEPFYFQSSTLEPFTLLRVSVPIVLLITVAAVLCFIARHRSDAEDQPRLRVLLVFLLFPLLTAFTASWALPYSVWATRHLIIIFAPAALIVGIVVGRIDDRRAKIAISTLLFLLSGYALVIRAGRETPMYSWCAWQPLAAEAANKNAEKLYVFEDLAAYHFWFAFHQAGHDQIQVAKVQKIDGVTEDTAFFLPRGFDGVSVIGLDQVVEPRFWIAYRGETIDETKPPLKSFIDRGYRVADRKMIATEGENAILIYLEKGN